MAIERDCNTCRFHNQAGGIEGTDEQCWSCRSTYMPYLPHWQPLEQEEPEVNQNVSALSTQVGGSHYTSLKIQPMHYSLANGLNAAEHTAIKYITRRKGDFAKRLEDLDKAVHVIQMLKEEILAGTCK